MLNLQSASTDRWLAQVAANLEELLIDHAHCEKKAASTAMSLLFAYVEQVELARAMADIVAEEIESEARHHSTYVRLARLFASEDDVRRRLAELAAAEAAIIAQGDDAPRVHS